MAEDKKAEAKKKEGAKRKPSALKRDQQSEKKRLRNKSYRASVLTAVRSLESSINQKESAETLKTKLNAIYSLMDKGVKHGVYKAQKAARTKSRLTARCAK
ncbi:MAG: 30S ribosomal protein S20 [Parachlamydiales bacterium]|nr:30S ribosomal protein S20 [Parachlamydiales bacterium]